MNNKLNNKAIYRTLWRWHFYAGLFCIPFIISLSITGAIFLFKPQITHWVEQSFNNLASDGERSSPQQQIEAALAAVPQSTFASYRLPERPDQAVAITLRQQGERVLVYLNPYSLDILKTQHFDTQFIRIIRALHGELMLGNAGSVLVELAGCWAIVLIITGVYLWWPRSAKGLAGVLYPRINQGKRTFLRDLHAVGAMWAAAFTLFLLISGLPWALVWGSAFKEVRALGQKSAPEQDWTINQVAAPEVIPSDLAQQLSPSLLRKAQQLNFAHPVQLGIDRQNPQQWKLSSQHQNRPLRADAWFSASGELLRQQNFSERPLVDRIIGIGIAAHEGHLFGWLNQLLGLLVCALLITVSVSGFLMWYRRKPPQSLGAPPAIQRSTTYTPQVGRVIFIVTLIAAVLLPALFISLLIIKLLEWMVLSRIPASRDWLGLQ